MSKRQGCPKQETMSGNQNRKEASKGKGFETGIISSPNFYHAIPPTTTAAFCSGQICSLKSITLKLKLELQDWGQCEKNFQVNCLGSPAPRCPSLIQVILSASLHTKWFLMARPSQQNTEKTNKQKKNYPISPIIIAPPLKEDNSRKRKTEMCKQIRGRGN